MYEKIKEVIDSGKYELSDMLKKIDIIWLQGDIAEEQKSELVAMAREKADLSQSADVLKKLEEFDKRLTVLENKEQTEPGEEYPAYVPGKWYYENDKITFTDGKKYICIAPDGAVCTWSPAEYPAYWKVVE